MLCLGLDAMNVSEKSDLRMKLMYAIVLMSAWVFAVTFLALGFFYSETDETKAFVSARSKSLIFPRRASDSA